MGGLVRKRTRSECDSFAVPVKKTRSGMDSNNAASAVVAAVKSPVKAAAPLKKQPPAQQVIARKSKPCWANILNDSSACGVEVATDATKSVDYVVEDTEVCLKMPHEEDSTAAAKENMPPPSAGAAAAVRRRASADKCAEAKEQPKDDAVDDRETNRRSPNGFLLPDPLPKGEVLTDSGKQEWVLGKPIGLGGFGELYLASRRSQGKLSPENFVIKIEPHSNGPLFVEVHFYIRATRDQDIKQFKNKHNIKHLGVPSYIGSGTHRRRGKKFRFLVMDRFGSDLQRILDHSEGGRFTDKTVCEVGIQVVDSLQYIHKQGYVHKDVKAANLLVGLGMSGQHKVHLVDYGLCSTYKTGSIHKQYIHDDRWAHEGTLEYTSRDSHIGCTSRRGDVEVLLYNLVEWWGGSLPWDRDIANPAGVKVAKFRAFSNPHKFLRHCFRRTGCNYPQILNRMMHYIAQLRFEQEPDYNYLKGLFRQQMKTFGCVQDGRLEFRLGVSCPPVETEEENLDYLKPLEPQSRVSGVFDRLCVSSKSWEASREEMISKRDEEALVNPTPAMLELMAKMRERSRSEGSAGARRHRKKSFNGCPASGEVQENTPAMLEVIRARQLRLLKEAEESAAAIAEEDDITNTTTRSVIFSNNEVSKGFDVARAMAKADESLRASSVDLSPKVKDLEQDDVPQDASRALLIPKDLLRVSPIPPEVVAPLVAGSGRSSPGSDRSSGSGGAGCRSSPRLHQLQLPLLSRKHSLDTDFDVSAARENAGLAIDVNSGGAGGGRTPTTTRLRCGRELSRLDIFVPPAAVSATGLHHMRTRSADAVEDGVAVRTLRSAFKDGVSKLFRQVSDSFTNIF